MGDKYIKLSDAKNALADYIAEQTVSKYGSLESCMDAKFAATGAMNELDYVPPADVVPKSEVERLQAELDSKQFRCDSCDRIMLTGAEYRACVKQAKAEIAREIFEEIEKWLVHEYVPYIRGYSNSLSRNFDELKKKYTEEQT